MLKIKEEGLQYIYQKNEKKGVIVDIQKRMTSHNGSEETKGLTTQRGTFMYITDHASPITHYQSQITHYPSRITDHASPITHHEPPTNTNRSPQCLNKSPLM
jgi:hypothetical protein